jgi:hypothetical protein
LRLSSVSTKPFIGILTITGVDKALETGLVEVSPQSLTDMTTRF